MSAIGESGANVVDVRQALSGAIAAGNTVTVRGWVRTRRDSKAGLSFVNLSDGSCFDAIQVVAPNTLPNYDSAKSFARRHDGKVFLAGYGNMDGDMLAWGDAPTLSVSERRTDEDLRDRYTVRLDQYKCMQVSMGRFASKMCLFPDPEGLVQEVLEKGKRRMSAVCKEYAFFHFTRTALVAEKDEEEKKMNQELF